MNPRKNLLGDMSGITTEFLLSTVLFLSLLLYYFFIINPMLYFAAQDPVFFFDKVFFRDFAAYPGGLADYLAALFSQFYYFPLLGSAVLALLGVAFILLARRYLKAVVGYSAAAWSFLPLLLLLLSHNNYEHKIVIDIALVSGTAAAVILTKLSRSAARLLFFIIGGAALYYAAGMAFLYFSILAILYEIFKTKRLQLSLVELFLAGLYPWFSASFLFLITLKGAYLHPLTSFEANIYALLIFCSIPFLVIVLFLKNLLVKVSLKNTNIVFAASLLTFIAVFGFSWMQTNKSEKLFWQVTYDAQFGKWNELLRACKKPHTDNPQISFQMNRALCHLGKIDDTFFHYNRHFNIHELFLIDEEIASSPLILSDFYFDLCHFVEAEHWAYEALSVQGESGWILERLAMVNLITGENRIAAKYLSKLEKTIPFKKWARAHEKFLYNHNKLEQDPAIGPKLTAKINNDFLSFIDKPEHNLFSLLERHPDNRMAFDYYMLELLVTKQLGRFMHDLSKYSNNFNFTPLPVHFQEALILYASTKPKDNIDVKQFKMNVETLKRFAAFKSEYLKNKNNKEAAKKALKDKYGDTYWYYFIFSKMPERV